MSEHEPGSFDEVFQDALDKFQVHWRIQEDPFHETWPKGFPYGVSDESGFIALFTSEDQACEYRMSLVFKHVDAVMEVGDE